MINRVVLVGRLTKDPNFMENNVAVANFTLAVNRSFKSKNGEQETDFINVVTFRKQAENVNNYLSKGSLVGVDGRFQSRSYENKEGQRVFVTEVVADSVQFLEPKGNNNQQNVSKGQQTGTNKQQSRSDNPFANANGPIDITDDDLPF
ncbi:single-stranded DNA-binding protein [Staphylococcus ureilyticus]|uniref:single-stranded DNA-binding protein n=1 Tax=Staphylococcus ureilyticus TaxID=94138 RepID=UPI00227CE1D1|nr:single-stranded DNA-binding protein [Staphylococcus ureilyticus]